MDHLGLKVLDTQGFAGSGLVRGLATFTSDRDSSLLLRDPGCRFVLVAGRQVGCCNDEQTSQCTLCWFDDARLHGLGFQPSADAMWAYEYRTNASMSVENDTSATTTTATGVVCPLYYLGKEEGKGTTELESTNKETTTTRMLQCYIALDVSEVAVQLGKHVHLMDLRHLLNYLSPVELARAGHAVALSQWHHSHRYCPKCGSVTIPIAAGCKRECTQHDTHKQYPRTDPVIIVLVYYSSPQGDYALLGRSLKLPAGMLTCLSGFIDVGESIEEAVVREVAEEAGVQVTSVRVIGSQPWPLGRGGSHELMIGCIAQATSMELNIDHNEMAECRWVTRSELKDVFQLVASQSPSGNMEKQHAPFFIPPPMAIAHHLIKAFVMQKLPQSPHQQEEPSPLSNM